MSRNFNIKITEELAEEMRKFKHINYSELCRKAIHKRINIEKDVENEDITEY